jgi:hypothetical protein
MALATAQLKSSLIALFNNAQDNQNQTNESLANSMCDMLETWVKSGTVTVTVSGVQSGASSAPGTGSIA